MQISTVAQLVLLEPVQADCAPVCVANTHLFFHPRAAHIRTLCTAAILEEALAFMQVSPCCLPGRQTGPMRAVPPTADLCSSCASDGS